MVTAVVAVALAAGALWYGGQPPEVTAALSLITWWTIAGTVAFGLLPVSRLGRPALLGLALLLGLTLLTGASWFWTNNEGMAFDGVVQMICLLGLFVLALLLSREGEAVPWLKGIAIGLSVLVALAALSRFFPAIGNDTELAKSLYGSSGRLSWPLGYWNAMGAVAVLGFLTVGWLGAALSNRNWRLAAGASLPVFLLVLYLTSSRGALAALLAGLALLFVLEHRRKRLLVVMGAGVLGGAILVLTAGQMSDLVRARSGGNAEVEGVVLFALTVLVVAAAAVLLRRFEERLVALPVPRPNRPAWIVIGILAVLAIVAINPVKQIDSFVATPKFAPEELQRSVEVNRNQNLATAHLLSFTGNGRWQYWSTAVEAFGDRPFVGIGVGGYGDYYNSHRESMLFGKHPHSLPLGFLAELGLLGFLIAAGFLVTVVLTGWRRLRAGPADSPTSEIPVLLALLLTGLVSMSVDWTSEFPVVAAPVLIAMAALIGPATRRPGTETDSEPSFVASLPGWLKPSVVVPLVAILFAGAAIVFSAWGYGISSEISNSKDALSRGDLDEAISKGQKAVDLAPWSAAAQAQLSAAHELSSEYIPALDAIDEAIDHAPLDSVLLLAKARILGRLGDFEATLKWVAKARRLDPHSPLFEFAKSGQPGVRD